MASLNTPLPRFFTFSLALHILALFSLKLQFLTPMAQPEPIAVSLLPQVERESAPPARAPKAPKAAPAGKIAKSPPAIAKKNAMVGKTIPSPIPENPTSPDRSREEPRTREPIEDKTVVVERPLPSVKELLPSANWSSLNTHPDGPVSLNTRDPVYVTYFTKIKQSIEQQWEYPEMALRYGLQGKLWLEFTIGGSGQLERLRVIRSSGSELLDQEAVRAIKAAAPFPPIPTWIKSNPLSISASMEYHDNRLNYRFNR